MGLGQFLNRAAGNLVNPTNSLGMLGKAISQASGGPWGDALSLIDQQQRQSQNDQMDQALKMAQFQAMTAKQNRNQIVQLPNGGIAAVDPDTNEINVLREPSPETHDPSSVAAFKYMQGLPKEQQDAFRRILPGFGNTDEGLNNQRSLIDYRAGAARATKLAPTYSAMHPSGGASPFGRSKANPIPVKGEADLSRVPSGTWVSPAPGVVFQKR